MGTQWQDQVNTSAQQTVWPRANCQLADGTLVLADSDGAGRQWLKYRTRATAAGTGPTTIEEFATTMNQVAAVCTDNAGNLYAFGQSSTAEVAYQAFLKGSGYSWTNETLNVSTPVDNYETIFEAYWCDTSGGTGGHGHIVILAEWAVSGSAIATGALIFDAGAMLAGSSALLAEVAIPGLGGGSINVAVAGAQDGVGNTSGIAFWTIYTSEEVQAATWSINSAGTLTWSVIAGSVSTVSMDQTIWAVRYAPESYACFYADPAGTGYFAAVAVVAGVLGSPEVAPAGAMAGMPTASGQPTADVFVDPSAANKAWVIGFVWPSSGNVTSGSLTVYRVACTFISGTPIWATASIEEDTLSLNQVENAFACVKAPRGPTIDWYTTGKLSSNYAVFGDSTTFSVGFMAFF